MDVLNLLFYSLVWIIIHALLQEYIWEVSQCVGRWVNVWISWLAAQRTVKRLHLSKVKTSKYYDSGCLVVFYLVSVVWGVDIILSCGYATSPALLWHNYPHTLMRCVLRGDDVNVM